MKETTCPGCKNSRFVRGLFFDPLATRQGHAARFKPDGLKDFTLSNPILAILGGETFFACLDCGLLWSGIDQNELSDLLTEKGTKKTKKQYRLTNN
ncbi:MAG: hypothetical protein KAH23_07790 [Kiritimatiellae bacterium]|nr:hypothetical protein [Kiritimatiellia bacterium]